MTNNAPALLIAIADQLVIIKVNGRANFTSSVTFKRLVGELRHRGFHNFVLDLSDCVTMDSTFLGVLAGTAVKLAEGAAEDPPSAPTDQPPNGGPLRLLNPNQRVTELLDNLGVSELFQTMFCNPPVAGDELTPAQDAQPSREEVSRTCLEAHRVLMEVNPENVPRFKDVAQFLAEDLKKICEEREGNGPQDKPAQPVEVS